MKILRPKIIIATPVEIMIFDLKIFITPLFRFEHEISEKSVPGGGGTLLYSLLLEGVIGSYFWTDLERESSGHSNT